MIHYTLIFYLQRVKFILFPIFEGTVIPYCITHAGMQSRSPVYVLLPELLNRRVTMSRLFVVYQEPMILYPPFLTWN